MRLSNLLSFTGFVMLIAGTWCPVLRPFHLFNWDVYDGSKPYGIVILLVAVVGIIGTVFNQFNTTRMSAWLSLVLVAVFFLMAWLKVHFAFSFLPFHSLDAYLANQIKYKWGWYLLFGGPVLAISGVLLQRQKSV